MFNSKCIIIDDVISAGTSIIESIDIIQQKGGTTVGAIVAVNRQERGEGKKSAIQEAEEKFNIKIISIISLNDIITYIGEHNTYKKHLKSLNDYTQQYGEIK